MNKLKIGLASICMFLGASFANAAPSSNIDDYKILSEVYPPYNFVVEGKLQGISVDVLSEILKDMGTKKNIEAVKVESWSSAYEEIQKNENIMLFSTARSPERESLFKWVGPIASSANIIVAKKKSKIKITDIKDINNYITAVEEDSVIDLMIRDHVKDQTKVLRVKLNEDLITLLNSDRVNLICMGGDLFAWEMKIRGFNPKDYEKVYALKERDLYYAFSKETPESLIDAMQTSLDKIKNSALYQDIVKKYIG
jgi:polar amino acid transport system substrate-binding protein